MTAHLLLLLAAASGGGDGGGSTPQFQTDAPSVIAYLGFAIAGITGAAQAITAFTGRRRRKEAQATTAHAEAQTEHIRDGTQLDWRKQDSTELAAERAYSLETRVRAEQAETEVRRLRDQAAIDRRHYDDRIDQLEDRFRALALTVSTCSVPSPPGCPLAGAASAAIALLPPDDPATPD